MHRTTSRLIGILVVATLVGCGAKKDPIQCGENALAEMTDVTYTRDIEPILADHCLGCHDATRAGVDRNSAPAGVDFDTYTAANVWSDRIVARASAGTMPPGGGPMALDDRCRLVAWQEGGFVQ